MNTRTSFLLVALLVGVCCAVRCQELPALPEPVLAIQRCFPQATVRLLPEVRFDGEITPAPLILSEFYPREIATISPDGRRLFFMRELEGENGVPRLQSYFLDLTTGEASLTKMLEDWEVEPLFLYRVVWDPVEPAYLYAMRLDGMNDDESDDDFLYSIWGIHVETLAGAPILPTGATKLWDITPDGQYLLFDRWNGDLVHPALYSLETHTWTPQILLRTQQLEDLKFAWPIYAPNGELVAGFTKPYGSIDGLAVMDPRTSRLAQVFTEHQTWLSIPNGLPNLNGGAFAWLPDSAGLLVNMRSSGDDETEIIWKVGINGEASAITSGVRVITNSQNGRHWLLQHDQQFYVMTVEDESPEE